MRKSLNLLLALLVSVAFAGAGCSSSADKTAALGGSTSTVKPSESSTSSEAGGSATGSITVSAAASLTTAFETIGENFKKANPGVTDVKFNFDGSSTLVTQIQGGAPADGFASADEGNMSKLTNAGLIAGTPQVFARNQLIIVVKQGNPKHIESLADLATAGTISLCGVDVPCGKYADQILKAANVTIPVDKITRGQNVKATLAAVAEGDADAGIVYVTDVVGDKVDGVKLSDAQNAFATYPIGVVKASQHSATMRAFIAYLLSPAGQDTMKSYGFLPPA